MLSYEQQQTLRRFLSGGAIVITANRRLQRALVGSLAPADVQAQPAIFSADDWLREQWLDLQDIGFPGADRTLISPYQSRKLWQDVIEQSPPAQSLISPAQLARDAEAAGELVDEWQLPLTESQTDQREEYRHFSRWLTQFQTLLAERGLASEGYARTLIHQAFTHGALAQLPAIYLYGFDDVSPRLRNIFEAAAPHVEHWQPCLAAQTALQRTAVPDTEAEIRAAALWSLRCLEANPSARIGIVVPELTQMRAVVERIFSEVFEPASWLPHEERRTPPFNFSAGVSLSDTPLIADALVLLGLNLRQIAPHDWRRLLLSPFWGDGLDDERRRLLLQLNRSSRPQLSVRQLRRSASNDAGDARENEGSQPEQHVADLLASQAEHARRQPARQSYRAWADFFAEQLHILGWPGSRVLDSPEYQQREHFSQVLDQLGQLDLCAPKGATLTEALTDLKELAAQTVFQAQTRTSPVQILGLLEAAGLQFDHCWVMNLTDTRWPPAAKPNPFIPLDIQRQLNLPRASAERELLYARALTQRLQQSAPDVIFSWPISEGDVHFQPSQLIRHAQDVALEQLVDNEPPLRAFIDDVAQTAQFEPVDCSNGPVWENLAVPLPGGTGAIALQAICPFNAFAVYRLGAIAHQDPVLGLTGAERGTILHELMAELWGNLRTQAALHATPAEALHSLIEYTAEAVLKRWQGRRSDVLHPRFFELEKQRLLALAQSWLALEQARPPFEVSATERQEHIQLQTPRGTATLCGRIDRIDTLPSGKQLVIDYKTGKVNINQWQGERPADLQLPLYALAEEDRVAAIAFAEITAKKTALAGVGQLSAEDGTVEGIVAPGASKNSQLPNEWPDVLSAWREAASQLVQEFLEGRCDTTFYNKSQAQYYRHLECLSRRLEADSFPDWETENEASE